VIDTPHRVTPSTLNGESEHSEWRELALTFAVEAENDADHALVWPMRRMCGVDDVWPAKRSIAFARQYNRGTPASFPAIFTVNIIKHLPPHRF